MGSFDNRFRRKWQDYGGSKATVAEHSFIEVFSELFKDTEYGLDNPANNHKRELYETYQYVATKHNYQDSA